MPCSTARLRLPFFCLCAVVVLTCLLDVGANRVSKRKRTRTKKGDGWRCPVPVESGERGDKYLEALISMARQKRALGSAQDIAIALSCAKRATSLFADSHRAWYLQGSLFQKQGNLEAAAAAYGGAVDVVRDACYAIGNRELERFLTCTSHSPAAVHIDPADSSYLHQLGGSLLMQGGHRAQDALPHLQRAHKLSPESSAIASDLALAQYYQGGAKQALKLWRRCARLDPKNEGQYLYNMVGVHQERSEWKAAKKLLTRMLALDPLSSETHESLGVVQATRRDYASALAAFSKSLALLPRRKHFDASDRVRLTTSVADTHMNQEHFALALAAFQEALASVSAQQAQGLPAMRLDRMLATQSSALYCALKICAWREAGPLRHSIVETWASLSDNRSAALEVACMHACVWMYVCMYVCVYLCTFACMRACVWM